MVHGCSSYQYSWGCRSGVGGLRTCPNAPCEASDTTAPAMHAHVHAHIRVLLFAPQLTFLSVALTRADRPLVAATGSPTVRPRRRPNRRSYSCMQHPRASMRACTVHCKRTTLGATHISYDNHMCMRAIYMSPELLILLSTAPTIGNALSWPMIPTLCRMRWQVSIDR